MPDHDHQAPRDAHPIASRAGFVAVAGRPNAGKSTLLNRLVGERLSIVSAKAQSTRQRVVGIYADEHTQLVILDTPGLLTPRDTLHTQMRANAVAALRDADVIVHLIDATEPSLETLAHAAALDVPPSAPVVRVYNKSDQLSAAQRESVLERAPGARLVSAVTGEGIDELLQTLRTAVPEGPFLYPADELSTHPLRFFCAELVRETALEQLDEEVPHALACAIEEFREQATPVYIRAVLYVERESQKRIVIGAGGTRIREIGRAAREKIEPLVGAKVFLDLWVKVQPNWRRDARALARFGYVDPAAGR
ncbi:MAG: GTPase Era [Gemmatimonadaceae bacterium]|jgi:GTP-binding protein Era|nr:GTPase Era [Gemmatimonadaceae bacterium]